MKTTPFKILVLNLFQDKNSNVQGRYTRKYAPELVSGFSRDKAELTLKQVQGIVAYTGMLAIILKNEN